GRTLEWRSRRTPPARRPRARSAVHGLRAARGAGRARGAAARGDHRARWPVSRDGRAARASGTGARGACGGTRRARIDVEARGMSAPAVETLLARLYTDPDLRREFLADPRRVAREAGLDSQEIDAFAAIDRLGLGLAAESYQRKRGERRPRKAG